MKNIFLSTFILFFVTSSFSQSFDITNLRVGGGIHFVSDINSLGLGLNGAYEFTEKWEGTIAYTYIFEKEFRKWSVFDFDAHYNFYQKDERLNAFALAGLSFNVYKIDVPSRELSFGGIVIPGTTDSGTKFGINLGIGANYKVLEYLNVAPEIRVSVMDGHFFRLGLTAQYMF